MADNQSGPNLWSLLIAVSAMATVVGITYIAIDNYSEASDVVSVLGAALPVVGVVAGAFAGVAIAWPAGKAKGEADGRTDAKKQAAAEIEALLPADTRNRGIVPDVNPQDARAEAIVAGVRGIVAGLRA